MKRIVCFALLCLLVLTACDILASGALTLEEAIEQYIASNKQTLVTPVTVSTTEQIGKWSGESGGEWSAVLYSYEAWSNGQDQAFKCLGYIERKGSLWKVRREIGTCRVHVPNTTLRPFELFDLFPGLGPGGVLAPVAWGFMPDPSVHWVVITWTDGQRQRVPVRNGGYMAINTNQGRIGVAAKEALDDKGGVLYRYP